MMTPLLDTYLRRRVDDERLREAVTQTLKISSHDAYITADPLDHGPSGIRLRGRKWYVRGEFAQAVEWGLRCPFAIDDISFARALALKLDMPVLISDDNDRNEFACLIVDPRGGILKRYLDPDCDDADEIRLLPEDWTPDTYN